MNDQDQGDDDLLSFADFPDLDPDHAAIMDDAWRVMSGEQRERFVRFAERLAALPKGLHPSQAQFQSMWENDSEFPFN